jgi:hypothetical protein
MENVSNFMRMKNIQWAFDILYGHLGEICLSFPPFGKLSQEKSGKPDAHRLQKFLINARLRAHSRQREREGEDPIPFLLGRHGHQGNQIGRIFGLMGDYFLCGAFENCRSSKSFWTTFTYICMYITV